MPARASSASGAVSARFEGGKALAALASTGRASERRENTLVADAPSGRVGAVRAHRGKAFAEPTSTSRASRQRAVARAIITFERHATRGAAC